MSTRRKRYKPSIQSGLVLTARDEMIILSLHRHRFLNTQQIKQITGSSSLQHLQRRLRHLFDHQYIDRPRAQIAGTNAPMIYGLGDKGACYLKDKHGIVLDRQSRWREKNAVCTQFFLEHTIAVAEQLIAFERASNCQFLDMYQIIERGPSAQTQRGHPLSIPASVTWNRDRQNLNLVPDGLFGLHFPSQPDGKQTVFFMLETDQGTMPVVRHAFRQSSILKKMLAYADIICERRHSDIFGFRSFRVLWVTTSEARIKSMQAAYAAHVKHLIQPGFFLFTTKHDLEQHGGLSANWQTASGKPVSLDPERPVQA